jgi:hypothetical protein
MAIDPRYEEIIRRNQRRALAVSPTAVVPVVGDSPAIVAVWTKMTVEIAEEAGYRFS